MSQPINDGGPAFALGPTASTMKPHADGGGHMIVTHYGMERGISIRDYFAGQAMAAIITSVYCTPETIYTEVSSRAYAQADAMLKAREAK